MIIFINYDEQYLEIIKSIISLTTEGLILACNNVIYCIYVIMNPVDFYGAQPSY